MSLNIHSSDDIYRDRGQRCILLLTNWNHLDVTDQGFVCEVNKNPVDILFGSIAKFT